MKIQIHKESQIEPTPRTELLGSMFEVPATTKLSVTLSGELNLDLKPWNIGLIVGPSGSGKTLLLEELFGKPCRLEWNSKSVIDDFDKNLSMEDISRVCQSVGFNTIPSWMRPYSVLSNGERFRVEVARRLLSSEIPQTADSDINCLDYVITIDEFTSVVDRQVAQIASHSVQKYIRTVGRRMVVASCHYDIIDWLQPDWILEPGNPCRFSWRSLQRRPSISCKVQRVEYKTWELFREFHYMSAELNKAARCYGLYVANGQTGSGDSRVREGFGRRISQNESFDTLSRKETERFKEPETSSDISAESNGRSIETNNTTDVQPIPLREGDIVLRRHRPDSQTYRIASMCGVLYRPHPRVSDIYGFTRMVTLPDFQGLGLAFTLACRVASAYKALGKRLHSYPNHPAWIRSYQRSPLWIEIKQAGSFSPRRGSTSTVGGFGGRRCAVFMYIGPLMNKEEAERLIHVETE